MLLTIRMLRYLRTTPSPAMREVWVVAATANALLCLGIIAVTIAKWRALKSETRWAALGLFLVA